MNQNVHICGEGTPTPVSVSQLPEAAALIAAAKERGIVPADAKVEEVILFALDEDEPLSADRLKTHGKERLRIHCHRCRKVEVTVVFNGQKHAKAFAPSVLVRRVLKWAIKEFGLKGADAENKELRLGSASGQAMKDDAAIGSYVHYPKCELTAYLVDIVQPQG